MGPGSRMIGETRVICYRGLYVTSDDIYDVYLFVVHLYVLAHAGS